jgi:radical SAM superfamily enzyme YgiQ (UPF0313 family)
MKKKTKILFILSEFVPIGVELLTSIITNRGFQATTIYYDDAVPFLSSTTYDPAKKSIQKFEDFLIDSINKEKPDLIGFSCFTSNFQWSLKCSKFIKNHFDIPIIFGGYHAIEATDFVIQESSIDMVCYGEGEIAIIELLEAIEENKDITKIKNLWIKQDNVIHKNEASPLVQDLDALPFPDKSVYAELEKKSVSQGEYLMMGSRGCFYRCSFCSNNFLATQFKDWHKVRYRSPENIFAELDHYMNTYNVKLKYVDFTDDIVAHNNTRLAELFYGFKERFGIPYTCLVYPLLINEESFKILSETNCTMLRLGLQSTNEELRRNMTLRKETNAKIEKIAGWAHKYNVPFAVDQIFGLPYERNEDLVHSVKFYNKIRPSRVVGHRLIYLPQTKAVDDAIEEGRITEADREKINRGECGDWTWLNTQMPGADSGKNISKYEVLVSRVSFMYSMLPRKSQEYINKKIDEGFLTSEEPLSKWRILFFTGMAKLNLRNIHLIFVVARRLLFHRYERKFFSFQHTAKEVSSIPSEIFKDGLDLYDSPSGKNPENQSESVANIA